MLIGPATWTAAHGGLPGLIAEPDPVRPGGTLEIRGDNLGADESVSIVLIVAGQAMPLASATADGEGHLTAFVTMPADVPAGRYALQALAAGGYLAAGSIELAGAPIDDQQGAGDPLERGPIGSFAAPASVPVEAGQEAPNPIPMSQSPAGTDAIVLVAALALPAVIFLMIVVRRRRAIEPK